MNQTVGQKLRAAREQLGISLEDAARETHIRLNYLQELESDHPELLHSAAQARGFLGLYADFLKLSYTELQAQWETKAEEPQPPDSSEAEKEGKSSPLPGWLAKILPGKNGSPQPQADARIEQVQPADTSTEVQGSELQAGFPNGSPPDRQPEEDVATVQLPTEGPQITEPSSQADSNLLSRLAAGLARLSPLGRTRKMKAAEGEAEGGDGSVPAQAPPPNSEELFRQIGTALHTRRKQMDLSLADIENFTNLKRMVLIAMEEGRFSDLPSSVQGRGMLNNYAKFLGVQEGPVIELYGRALQLRREERFQPRPSATPSITVKVKLPEKWGRIINPDLIIGAALILGLFTFIIWGATQVFSNNGGNPTDAPSISEVLQITPSLAPTDQAEVTLSSENGQAIEGQQTAIPGVEITESTPTVVATVNAAPLQVYIIAHDRAFLRVSVDGVKTFDGRVSPGNVYTYSGNTSISLLTGNAAALEVYFNQEYLGKLGRVGEVSNINFTLAGLITPTPMATFTPTPALATGGADGLMTEE